MRSSIFLILFIAMLFPLSAQEVQEVQEVKQQRNGILGIGISGGIVNYKGDLDDKLSFKFTKPGFGVHLYVVPYYNYNISLNYFHGQIECDDAKMGISRNKYRNLNFYSNIDEISIQGIYRYQDKSNTFTTRQPWAPYIFAGIALFHFNPKTKLNGKEYELNKVGTEGQHLKSLNAAVSYPKPYHLWQISFPFGLGVKYKIDNRYDIGLEAGFRKTLTDYLDDVSGVYPDKEQLLDVQGAEALALSDRSNYPNRPNGKASFSRRGDPDWKDWYTYGNICFTYYFTTTLYQAKQHYLFLIQ